MPQVACGNVKSIKRSTDFAQASGKELDTSASHNKAFTKPLTAELLSSFKRATFIYFLAVYGLFINIAIKPWLIN